LTGGRHIGRRLPAGIQDMAKTNPFEFIQQVRQEGAKVTWPTRRETMITTVMVMIMVALAALFFLGVDAILRWVVDTFLLYGA
jgi:preprotein translocase subunit SecE